VIKSPQYFHRHTPLENLWSDAMAEYPGRIADHRPTKKFDSKGHFMRQSRSVIGWLPLLLLTACAAPQTEEPIGVRSSAPTPGSTRAAFDRILTPGDIQVAEAHLQAFGYDPGPVDGLFTAQTQAAVRAFQRRYGLSVSGLLDRETRRELIPGLDPIRKQ
jgi:Putative peptidoglycan binding domain